MSATVILLFLLIKLYLVKTSKGGLRVNEAQN